MNNIVSSFPSLFCAFIQSFNHLPPSLFLVFCLLVLFLFILAFLLVKRRLHEQRFKGKSQLACRIISQEKKDQLCIFFFIILEKAIVLRNRYVVSLIVLKKFSTINVILFLYAVHCWNTFLNNYSSNYLSFNYYPRDILCGFVANWVSLLHLSSSWTHVFGRIIWIKNIRDNNCPAKTVRSKMTPF